MLMTLGPIQFEVQPFNATDYDHAHETSFAEKPVVGASPPLEWVGERGFGRGARQRGFARAGLSS